jgi:hypothetical protein
MCDLVHDISMTVQQVGLLISSGVLMWHTRGGRTATSREFFLDRASLPALAPVHVITLHALLAGVADRSE